MKHYDIIFLCAGFPEGLDAERQRETGKRRRLTEPGVTTYLTDRENSPG